MDESLRLDFLNSLQRTGIVPGLERIRPLLARLNNPQTRFPSVLITGTNGKGSTAAFLEAIFRASGYRTGLFTSPHLIEVRERICIDGKTIEPEKFMHYAQVVRDAINPSNPVTYFEALTAIGFTAFAGEEVEIAVVEVGMGGRFDSTNVLDPLVSVLTNVSLDHQRFLGDTVDEIAMEKVGIARPHRTFVTGVDQGLWERVVGDYLAHVGARPVRLGLDIAVYRHDGCITWQGRHTRVERAKLSLEGTFQTDNAALALAAAEALKEEGFDVPVKAMVEGLQSTYWPGRFQRFKGRPEVILDGCHNPGAATRLRETLVEYPPSRPLILLHASKPDKDFRGVLAQILPLCDGCIETAVEGLAPPEVVAKAAIALSCCPVYVVERLPEALEFARRLASEDGTVLVTGSLYLVGAVLKLLREGGQSFQG